MLLKNMLEDLGGADISPENPIPIPNVSRLFHAMAIDVLLLLGNAIDSETAGQRSRAAKGCRVVRAPPQRPRHCPR